MILETLLSSLAGVGTGGLFAVVTGAMGFLKDRANLKRELKHREYDLKELELEASTAEKRDALALEREQTKADAKVRAASYKDAFVPLTKGRALSRAQSWLMVIADFFRTMVRPLVTFALVAAFIATYYVEPVSVLAVDMAHKIEYLTSVAVSWWFGDRVLRKSVR